MIVIFVLELGFRGVFGDFLVCKYVVSDFVLEFLEVFREVEFCV